MTDLHDWLDRRHPAPPGEMRAAIDAALAEAGSAGAGARLHDRLAEIALESLRRVAAEPSRRSTATRLLAADALLTYACEAAAEAGPGALVELTRRLDWDRFEELLEGVRS